jgi:hypothetical protein
MPKPEDEQPKTPVEQPIPVHHPTRHRIFEDQGGACDSMPGPDPVAAPTKELNKTDKSEK